MRGLQLISPETSIDFVGKRFITYTLSCLILLATIASVFWQGLNYGIDFKGGILLEVKTPGPANLEALRKDLSTLSLGEVSLQDFGAPDDILIRVERQPGDDEGQQAAVKKIQNKLGDGVILRRVETVGPKVGQDLINNGILAVFWSLVAMFIYVWFRFEWQFALCSIAALFHDALAIVGFYGIFQLEFNTTAIVAILITVGYSINDTVVVYDRIRENLRKYKVTDLNILINRSINTTLSRTVLTSGTTLLSLAALYFFGGEIIATYTLPIIVGVIVGTYSSIFLAAPLVLILPSVRDNAKKAKAANDDSAYRDV